MPIAIIIDALTNSIVDAKTKESFETEVLPFTKKEAAKLLKKDGWKFDWKSEFKDENRKIFKLVIKGNNEVQGLVSLEVKQGHIEMQLIESARHNFGRGKKYEGVPTNLVAYACRWSFDLGFEGYVGFVPKTRLIEHYRHRLGAEMLSKNRMQITTESTKKLVNSYYKDYKYDRTRTPGESEKL